MRYLYTGLRVASMDRARAFYAKLLGLRAGRRIAIAETQGEVTYFLDRSTGQLLELNAYGAESPYASEAGPLDHLGFVVEDVEAEVARLAEAGAQLLIPPFNEGRWRLAFLLGPDDVPLELMGPIPGQKRRSPAPLLGDRTAIGSGRATKRSAGAARFLYTGLRVEELESAVAFFRDVVGLKPTGRSHVPETRGEWATFKDETTGQVLELNWYAPDSPYAAEEGVLDHLGLEVSDIEQGIAHATDAGARMLIPPFAEGGVQLAFLLDEDGIPLELSTPSPSGSGAE